MLTPLSRLISGPRRGALTAFSLGACLLWSHPVRLHAAEPARPEAVPFAALDGVTLPKPRVFTYERSERDPFVDASVKRTLLSQAGPVEPAPQSLGAIQISQEIYAEILQNFKITGVVCNKRDGVVLIGRRILRKGDRLDLLLGEDLLKRMHALNQAQHLGWGDILSLGILPLEIIWVQPTGIGLSHSLQQEPVTLPFQKNAVIQSLAQSPAIPK